MEMTDRFLRACRLEAVDMTPVWFMRQAGRYMPEYRALREKYSLLELCRQPDLATEVTLQPVRALGVDAAILFADILLPAIPLGVGLEFAKGEGPVLQQPVRSMADVERLKAFQAQVELGYVMQALKILRQELHGLPLIGFCGAPFTLASYIVEGGSSREFTRTKSLMYTEPATWHALMVKLSVVLAGYITAQIEAGAQAVQIFDSWVGALSPQDYVEFVQPYSRQVLQAAESTGVPVIHFGTGATTLLPAMRAAGGTVMGLDWRIGLDDGWKILGNNMAVQGNLDPAALFAPPPELKKRVEDVLRRAGGRAGHIFNLGHGILQNTPVGSVKAVVEMVHEYSAEGLGVR